MPKKWPRLPANWRRFTSWVWKIGLVVGGGNFFRGVEEQAKEMDRVSADNMGMLSTVINAIALQDALEQRDVQCRVMTRGVHEPDRRAVHPAPRGAAP